MWILHRETSTFLEDNGLGIGSNHGGGQDVEKVKVILTPIPTELRWPILSSEAPTETINVGMCIVLNIMKRRYTDRTVLAACDCDTCDMPWSHALAGHKRGPNAGKAYRAFVIGHPCGKRHAQSAVLLMNKVH